MPYLIYALDYENMETAREETRNAHREQHIFNLLFLIDAEFL